MKFNFTLFLIVCGQTVFGQLNSAEIKAVQKSLAKVNENLYASKYEVSNKVYSDFLIALRQNGKTDKYQTAMIDTSAWGESPYTKYYHKHPAYNEYPAVNISYEGARLFCEWLTEQYNTSEKRKFKRVNFRLPSEQEWVTAAKAGHAEAHYPWKYKNVINEKGEAYCNHSLSSIGMREGDAGNNGNADITAPVKSYKPNDFGLYNMSGNVAEMLNEKGKTKGGSWRDSADDMKIESKGEFANYQQPMITVGFRYFMEVLEK
ncbi:MAG: SUMF1/EgtB/PvdO family nonheme iron enzyme [Bacteroidia bacterium]